MLFNFFAHTDLKIMVIEYLSMTKNLYTSSIAVNRRLLVVFLVVDV
jgi:hypothetical protein